MKTSTPQKQQKTNKPASAKSSKPSAAKSPLGKPAALPARPTHTSTRKAVKAAKQSAKPVTKARKPTVARTKKPAPKGRKVSAVKPSKPANNLPAVPRIGLRLNIAGRDHVVIRLGTRDRVTCLKAFGSKLVSVREKWGALRKSRCSGLR